MMAIERMAVMEASLVKMGSLSPLTTPVQLFTHGIVPSYDTAYS